MSVEVVISGAGIWKPEHRISNEELVASFNSWVDRYNAENVKAIESGQLSPQAHSSEEFIEKAAGIRNRYVYIKDGILDVDRMRPRLRRRDDEELSHQAEIALHAAQSAMAAAGKTGRDIDMVIVSCAYTERAYPAIAIEVQQALGIRGVGFDMLVACSSATFGLQRACDAIKAGSARAVLVINPELITPQVNFRDRDSHFLFGDVSTAVVVETAEGCTSAQSYSVLGTGAETRYSNNIRSNFGYMAYADDTNPFAPRTCFISRGERCSKKSVRWPQRTWKLRSRGLESALATCGGGGCTRPIRT